MMAELLTAAALLSPAFARSGRARDQAQGKAVITQDIAIKGAGAGPSLPLPAPGADRAVVDEVVDSLKIMSQDHAARAASVQVPGAEKLSRPFPEAPYLTFSPRSVSARYDLWTFEVVEAPLETLMRQDGTGRVVEPIEWDGSGPAGDEAVRVGKTYFFRFTGRRGPESFVVTSEPVRLKSLALRDFLGATRLEVANSELFDGGTLSKASAEYLRVMADRMRRVGGNEPYKLQLYTPQPESREAKQRAAALKAWFADALLINAARVQVAVFTAGARGEVTVCLLPADRGDTIRVE
jgi:hypothetical protein